MTIDKQTRGARGGGDDGGAPTAGGGGDDAAASGAGGGGDVGAPGAGGNGGAGGEGRGGGAGRPPGRRESVSPIEFRLDPSSGVPTYLQLVQQVEHALRLGYLHRGDQLPRVRDVVGSLAINPNTVLKAYRELEHRGLAGGRPGQGTFVEGTLGRAGLPQQAELHRALLDWLGDADAAGLDPDGMTALFTAALRDFTTGSGARQPARPNRPAERSGQGRPGPGARARSGRRDRRRAAGRRAGLGPPRRGRVGRLAGGQRARVALTLAGARRPERVTPDEPLARLDPLARHEFMASLMSAVAED